MSQNITSEEIKLAKLPHDLFLVNLIGNHILTFVATVGLASSWAWPVLIVPLVSFTILSYIIIKARQLTHSDSWFIACHWQMALNRSLFFVKMLLLIAGITALGIYGYIELGWMKEAVYALIGGGCLLPTMVATLVLIIMESDALHLASDGKLPARFVKLPHDNSSLVALVDELD